MTLNDKLEAYFKEHENEWIDGRALAEIAGFYGWRSRVSNLRRKRGMVIDNDPHVIVKRADGSTFKRSLYRYVPARPLGQGALWEATQA